MRTYKEAIDEAAEFGINISECDGDLECIEKKIDSFHLNEIAKKQKKEDASLYIKKNFKKNKPTEQI
jgi:hypothetical protein